MNDEISSHNVPIRCSKATRVGSWASSVLAVLAGIHAVQDRSWPLALAALALGAFAAVSYRKSINDFITMDDHQLSVSNHPLGLPVPETVSWSAVLEVETRATGLWIRTKERTFKISLKEFPRGTAKRVIAAVQERAPWTVIK